MIDLKPFCYPDDDCVWDICNPFVQDGHTYATDGKIIVRIPTDKPDTELLHTPNVPTMIGWDACKNAATPWPTPCGRVDEDDDGITGPVDEMIDDLPRGHMIAGRYLALVASLPNPRYSVVWTDAKQDPTHARHPMIAFQFDGGEGLLMAIER